ncbi:MAG: ABC transporter permease [Deltaproteobacteria bacterium]|nr:ABC transporter permease [Deltaproteobacteria bacterium]
MIGTLLLQTLALAIPYVLAALGGVFSERGGVINIALEGMLLTGAFFAALGAHAGGTTLGLVAAVGASAALAGLHGLLCVRFRADHVAAGLGINLLASGLTRFLLMACFDSASNSPMLPGMGQGVLASPMLWGTIILVALSHVALARTPFGLRLRAAGEHPQAAHSLGVPVDRVKICGVIASGALAGLGGAFLALDNHQFTAEMSAGRGYIALAAVIFGKWRPVPVAAACLLFAFADALQIELQAVLSGYKQFVQILPYALTLAVLAGFIGRSRPPAALGAR